MKILIDIAHPAHIHYFRNFANILERKGHKCMFTLRDKGIIVELAKYYNLNYRIRSKERNSKVVYMLSAIKHIYKIAKQFRPDIFIDMGSIASAPVAKLLGKPYIAFDDTEASVKARLLHMPFTSVIITPEVFYKNLGEKQIRVNSVMELMYLNQKYFLPESDLIAPYVNNVTNFVLIRFVSWEAHHDVGKKGISFEEKVELVKYLSQKYEVIISSEGKLPDVFKKFKMKSPSHLMHHLLANAKFVITEGATMASESVVLGTPAIYINPIQNGYTIEQSEKGLLFSLKTEAGLLEKVFEIENILIGHKKRKDYEKRFGNYLENKIDITAFTVWFLENYPESLQTLKEDPDYQYKFK